MTNNILSYVLEMMDVDCKVINCVKRHWIQEYGQKMSLKSGVMKNFLMSYFNRVFRPLRKQTWCPDEGLEWRSSDKK